MVGLVRANSIRSCYRGGTGGEDTAAPDGAQTTVKPGIQAQKGMGAVI